jgi:type IV pilus assembly protein PilM
MSLIKTADSFLGIDIGGTGIKIVELKKESAGPRLLTYGFSENPSIAAVDWQKDSAYTAGIINKICTESGAGSRSAISALPTFSVFSSVLNLTDVGKKDIAAAVQWEAKKVIPLPLEEMILDWKYIEKDKDEKSDGNTRVLLTGAPDTLVKKYIAIFKEAQINLLSLETETFSLIRSLIGNDKSTIMILDIGSNTTDVTIVDKSIPMLNRSIDAGGLSITKKISQYAGISMEKADQLKYDLGINSLSASETDISKVIADSVSPIVNEIKYAINLFQEKYKKRTEKIITSGGSSMLPGLMNYFSKVLDTKVIIGDPWARINYPEDLKPLLNEIGPVMAVAVGLALREME